MPVKAKNIKDLPLKEVLDGSESLLVQDSNGTKQAPLGTIVDEIKQNSQEKIIEIESELDQTNAQLSETKQELGSQLEQVMIQDKNNYLLSRTIKKLMNKEPVVIVCKGDSTTYGDTGSGRATNPYPNWLGKTLKLIYNYNDITVINSGVNGQNSTEGLATFETTVLKHNPDCTFIMYGINDGSGYHKAIVEKEAFRANIRSMATQCLKNGSDVVIMSAIPTFCFQVQDTRWNDVTNRRIMTYGDVALEVAKELNVASVDLFKEIYNLISTNVINIRDFVNSTDWTHPTENGYKLQGELITRKTLDVVTFKNTDTISKDIPISHSQFVQVDVNKASFGNYSKFPANLSIVSDGSYTNSIKFIFYNNIKGLKLNLFAPVDNRGGNQIVKINRVDKPLNFYTPNQNAIIDVKFNLIEELPIGYILIEISKDGLTNTNNVNGVYYSSFSHFNLEKNNKVYKTDLSGTSIVYSSGEEIYKNLFFKNVQGIRGHALLKDKILSVDDELRVNVKGKIGVETAISFLNNIIRTDGSIYVGFQLLFSENVVRLYYNTTLISTYNGSVDLNDLDVDIIVNVNGSIKITNKDTELINTTTSINFIKSGFMGLMTGNKNLVTENLIKSITVY